MNYSTMAQGIFVSSVKSTGSCIRQVAENMRSNASKVLALAALLSVPLWPNAAAAKVTIVFGTYSPDKPSAMVSQLKPSLNRIAERMSGILAEDVEIRMQVVRAYEDGVDLITSGGVDFARLGPASYVMAKRRNPGLEILAMEAKGGMSTFNGVICVQSDSPIKKVEELKGKSFAFGSTDSTLGRYFSQLTLMREGVYARDLARYEYLGRHDAVGRAVGSGLFDAGALEETTFAKLVASGVPIRALVTFPNATRPWISRAGLEPRIRDALRQALLNLNDPDALQALRFDGFVEGSDSEYQPTREAIEENPRFFAEG